MKYAGILLSFLLSVTLATTSSYAEEGVRVEMFSPQGMVKEVRQVAVRFSEDMVLFGDPRLADPFTNNCPEKGRGRWADGKNWVYEFDRDSPAGVTCSFELKHDLRTVSGKPVTGQQTFSFSTGGPAIKSSYPREGATIDESQIFILALDAQAAKESILGNVSCSIEGVNERVGVKIIEGQDREKILKQFEIYRRGEEEKAPQVLVQCARVFPSKAMVSLVWGKGVSSLSGVATTEDQLLAFKVREPFEAKFRCQRENAQSQCIPILPMRLDFTAPVSWELAKKIVLKVVGGKIYKAEKVTRGSDNDESEVEEDMEAVSMEEAPAVDENFVYNITFKGPFPEKASFVLEVPKDLRDDAGRSLANGDSYPLTVKTDSYPPLAKFASRFGIVELKGDATLPVTLRNLEPGVRTRILKLGKDKQAAVKKAVLSDKTAKPGEDHNASLPDTSGEEGQKNVDGLTGRLHKVKMDREEEVIIWLKRVANAQRESPVLKGERKVQEFSLPKPAGASAHEVVGIPLKNPGLYVVEMESLILGTSLLGQQKPMYVPTAALVTNLSAHFKWGRETSLVWVTTLDKAEAVKGATVTVRDCNGKSVWKGATDENGIAYINKHLPSADNLPRCSFPANRSEVTPALSGLGDGLFVFAKTAQDMTFVHSSWNEGIEPWRYKLPQPDYQGPVVAHTVFDRSLLRAGETVHMKHFIRNSVRTGFSYPKRGTLPKAVVIEHMGSDQTYELPLRWDSHGTAETDWKIPKDAKLGMYSVDLLKSAPITNGKQNAADHNEREIVKNDEGESGRYSYDRLLTSGTFRVEEFRVPLMRALIQPTKGALVNASEAQVDLFVTYLSGGGASNAPVKLKSQVLQKTIHFDDYEDFMFSTGAVKEGVTRRSSYEEAQERADEKARKFQTYDLKLDNNGSLRTAITGLPALTMPQDIFAELEFRDPNGEIQTVSQRIALWPSRLLIGIKPDSWTLSQENLKFQVAVLDLAGKPVSGRDVTVDLFERKFYSHRKRLVGGFYSYEHVSETKKSGRICGGKTDSRGLLICESKSPISGNGILQAEVADDYGNRSVTNHEVWIAGKGEWWFDAESRDRIDLLPEKKKYEPGETARFQVRMPFRTATALVTVEREGIMETYLRKLSGKSPVIDIPVKGNYAPNVFISALVVRGRVAGVQPTALVDLGKPAYKLGIAEINVGRKAFELKVTVTSDKEFYRVREKAKVSVAVKRANGTTPPKGSEVVIAAVDEGLLELMPNKSWNILEAMMGRRGYEVKTSTAQMEVVGKRHYGLKAQPQGGGGGRQFTRELFDTLLLWKAKVMLNEKGEATVEIPLNDSVTSFRIVAVASGGTGLFGTGQTTIKSTQELMLMSGVPPVVREGDNFTAGFTVRNTSDRAMEVEVKAVIGAEEKKERKGIMVALKPGETNELSWEVQVPYGIDTVHYEVSAIEKDGDARDAIKVKQRVSEAIPVRTFQAAIAQVENSFIVPVEKPHDAVPGKGGITVSLKPKLAGNLSGVAWFMKKYPYTCMEQKVSRAVALRDETLWRSVVAELPADLDGDGLAKYFPSSPLGSDVLTSYILSIADEAGWDIPSSVKEKMQKGLKGFIEGKVLRYSSLPTADLSLRKIGALEALARAGSAEPQLLESITIEPNLWPTSAVLSWTNVLLRMTDVRDSDKKLKEAEQILRARLNFQGSTMGFSTEKTDYLWWLMVSSDVNAVKAISTFMSFDSWKQDMPRLVKGALARQNRGAWDLTTANAWGVLAMEKFSKQFESAAVSGATTTMLDDKTLTVQWAKTPEGKIVQLGWPKGKKELTVVHHGTGKPWALVRSLAAIPLMEPYSSGYKIKKTLIPVEQKTTGKWTRGDVIRVRLEVDAQADMTWVVVNDPIPSGASILRTGLGRDSQLLTGDERREGWVWPVFEERSMEAFRAYYEFVPKGKWTVEYTVRLNNSGIFHLPSTRTEALYSPEMLGELPNSAMEVAQ